MSDRRSPASTKGEEATTNAMARNTIPRGCCMTTSTVLGTARYVPLSGVGNQAGFPLTVSFGACFQTAGD